MLLFHRLLPLAVLILPALATISLSGFQSIIGFPQSCEDAYKQPVGGCDPSTDVGVGHKCSSICQAGLRAMQGQLKIACRGISVDPWSVLAQFYYGNGPAFVCAGIPYYEDKSGSSTDPSSSEVTTSTITETVFTSSTKTGTSHSGTTTVKDPSDVHHPSSTATQVTTSSFSSTTTTVTPLTTETLDTSVPGAPPATLTTAADKGTATVFSTQPQRTGSTNPDNYGGGGSPFEVSANGIGPRIQIDTTLWLMMVGLCLLVLNLGGR